MGRLCSKAQSRAQKEYRPREKDSETSTGDDQEHESKDAVVFTLDDWDEWFSTYRSFSKNSTI